MNSSVTALLQPCQVFALAIMSDRELSRAASAAVPHSDSTLTRLDDTSTSIYSERVAPSICPLTHTLIQPTHQPKHSYTQNQSCRPPDSQVLLSKTLLTRPFSSARRRLVTSSPPEPPRRSLTVSDLACKRRNHCISRYHLFDACC